MIYEYMSHLRPCRSCKRAIDGSVILSPRVIDDLIKHTLLFYRTICFIVDVTQQCCWIIIIKALSYLDLFLQTRLMRRSEESGRPIPDVPVETIPFTCTELATKGASTNQQRFVLSLLVLGRIRIIGKQ